jgi:dihydrofolate reductase
MREIVNSTYITLDGIVERPETWPALGGFSDEGNKVQTELLQTCSAALMGRRTYEGFAAVWPTLTGEAADKMNSMPKYVASTTLTDPTWNNTHVIKGDLVAAVEKLKEEPGDDIVQYGFGPTTRTLIAAGLLDRLRLWVHPFLLGTGGPDNLLYRDTPVTQFDLVDTTALTSGIVILDYRLRTGN